VRALLVGEGDLSHGGLIRRLGTGLSALPGVEARVEVLEDPGWPERALITRIPGLGHLDFQPLRWQLRYSLAARRRLQRHAGEADVALVNTQASALLAREPMRRLPVVLSVDTTGHQFAALEYWRPAGRLAAPGDAAIARLERRAYAGARRIVSWTDWSAASLVRDYGVPASRIEVLHFGVPIPPAAARPEPGGPLRLVMVGNQLRRKGLEVLLAALGRMRNGEAELHLVTGDALEPDPRYRVHAGVRAGTPEFAALLASAGAFVLPTRADAAPWAVIEALAAGLPVVSTTVGAIPELVGDAGLLVAPGDPDALARALDRLAAEPALATALAARARARALERYDERRQLGRLADVLADAAGA
jgi:glycosyltransferase involved in cell wall biosynthesis